MPSLPRLAQGTPSALLIAALLALAATGGCSPAGKPATTAPQTASASAPAPSAELLAAPTKGGAQLWVENCMRCHGLRDPSSYSDSQWEVAMHHMRVRANLTAQEHKLILAFLQSAN